MHWFIREHSHLPSTPICVANDFQALADSFVELGVIQLVHTVIGEKILQRLFHKALIPGIAQGASDQHGSAISDVGSDHFIRQLRPLEVPEHGIDGMDQV